MKLGSLKDEFHIPSSYPGGRAEASLSLGTCISPGWWEMQPSKADGSMKWIRKGGQTLVYYCYTRTKLIPENEC